MHTDVNTNEHITNKQNNKQDDTNAARCRQLTKGGPDTRVRFGGSAP